ncbi:MAG: FAD-dependent pyridine nucleotide-disulfide oxidoreductase [Deltaproteobacteria bacterium]|jgi:nitrite reductase (NADH) large subunit|nr:FAD-dependent pyridine nucleotide-disulfide oxidoreductase [Deltaproteobacteria bacterium]MBP1719056.1 FAD-dependent pyridine nucleotide-disulfide oxidoreductase [Deltaproteobacteria bacterium]
MKRYAIIGNGAAGNAAAETIRRIDPEGQIVMFSKGKHDFYYVPALPDYLCGEKQLRDFTIHNQAWYERNRVELQRDTEITEVRAGEKMVVSSRGSRFPYDELLLACGGYSFVPSIPGVQTPGVFSLRTLADADRIKERARQSRKAVVIGGGLLGLEAGNGLRRMGLTVSVVEFFPRLLPRQMDVPGAAILQRQMEGMGFRFFLRGKTQKIDSEGEGLAVSLEGGEKLYADIVLISAGVRPEISLKKFLNLQIDKAVKVDDNMRTGQEGIYAAGDLVEHRGRYYGIWPAAMEQGRVAGANMAGKETLYSGTVPSNTLKVVGIDLVAAGEIDGESKMEALVTRDEAGKTYRKFVLQGNAIIGAILLGDIRGSEEIQKAIKGKKDISALKDELCRSDFDFSRLRQEMNKE